MIVCCVEAGNYCGHGDRYVRALAAGVRRHLQADHRFVCLTDQVRDIGPGIEVGALDLEYPLGWWSKLQLFAPDSFPPGKQVLFFDLDTIIVGDLAPVAAYDGPMAILSDFYRLRRSREALGSGVMSWRAGELAHLWFEWIGEGCPQPKGGDQTWLEQRLGFDPDRWQDLLPGAFLSFKGDKLAAVKRPPDGTRVVCYHGQPKPHDCGSALSCTYWAPLAGP